jgi:NADH-quinone oxidoreductase subunit C
MSLTLKQVYERLRAKFPQGVTGVVECAGDPYAVIPAAAIVDVCKYLRDDPELRFELCSSISGTDDTVDFWVVYHLYSVAKNHRAVLKVKAEPRDNPSVPSVVGVWKAADWHEREAFDMYGIVFEGHPDLRRILLPEDWPGYPLRKDYEFPDEYQGIPLK